MAKPSLKIVNADYEYQIQWYFPDDGDFGSTLGESTFTDCDLKTCERDDRDHVIASITASKTEGVEGVVRDGTRGYYWPSKSAATAALRAIRIAIKSDEAPWPEWAIKAAGAGWKAPKGWKP